MCKVLVLFCQTLGGLIGLAWSSKAWSGSVGFDRLRTASLSVQSDMQYGLVFLIGFLSLLYIESRNPP